MDLAILGRTVVAVLTRKGIRNAEGVDMPEFLGAGTNVGTDALPGAKVGA